MNEFQPTDAEIEAILGGGQPSGDAALDAAFDALRELRHAAPPAPSPALRRVLGASLIALPNAEGRVAARGRHIATGSATIAGIVLASATAAAAIGAHEPTPSPSSHPATHAARVPVPATGSPRPGVTRPEKGPAVLPSLGLPALRARSVLTTHDTTASHDATGDSAVRRAQPGSGDREARQPQTGAGSEDRGDDSRQVPSTTPQPPATDESGDGGGGAATGGDDTSSDGSPNGSSNFSGSDAGWSGGGSSSDR